MGPADVGRRIRRLRKQQGWTLQHVADACAFTKSLLSKIETGKTAPPVATLSRIAGALRVPVASLVDDSLDEETIHTRAAQVAGRALMKTDKGYRFFAFASERANKAMQPFLFEAERGKVKAGGLSHEGQEFIYILEGEMKYRVGSVEYHLKPGDGLYFESEQEHDLQPVSKKVRYLGVFVSPDERPKRKPKKRQRAP